MEVLKIVAEGITTSFRYPHFMQGVQPTFEMPPPATIYGHICSALGEWVVPEGIKFAYHFTYQAKFDDVEHTHVLNASSGKLPGTKVAKVLEGAVNPFKRTILFKPRLVLYINKPEWESAFRSPRYPVVLGRSQDLFTYKSVKVVKLIASKKAYFEHTLAPYRMAMQTGRGYVVLMPRFLDYQRGRVPVFARYLVLHQRVYSDEMIRHQSMEEQIYWVDPESPQEKGAFLGLLFHTFVGDKNDEFDMAGVVG
ncbi:CRISPR-associated protein Cas5 [Desulfofundulus sp.]|uniref:CRISPR-associated protein Cas5 n=1 Tax=Desulfofundulus sp. TaxID=2282750 RepID=UPI003C714714